MRISDWSSDVCSSDLDWDEDLIAECHRRDSGKSFRSVYGRMRWEDVAPTMTTLCYGFGNGRFGHPEQDRAISLREASLFQTFPKTYQFIPKNERANFTVIGRLIGNAVPVRLGEVIAMSIADHLTVVNKAQKDRKSTRLNYNH